MALQPIVTLEKSIRPSRPPLSSLVSKIALGGGSFTYQSHPDPILLPVRSIIQHALQSGIRTFDTSPYYGPSESLLGDAFSQPSIKRNYPRNEYLLMTKVGRIAATEFDYSPAWIRKSITRSLQRLQTAYLDVVFCHDIEYVTDTEAVMAVGVLFELQAEGKIHYLGISGYNLSKLIRVANLVREKYGSPLDAVQSWAQLTLQNTRMENEGLPGLRAAGVDCIFNSSPLAVGLLRADGVPVGAYGDWHPAPEGLRQAVLRASNWVESQGEDLASLAMQFCLSRLLRAERRWSTGVTMVFASNSVRELESNLQAIMEILQMKADERTDKETLQKDLRNLTEINISRLEKYEPLFSGIRDILGPWVDYTFTSPENEWDIHLKKMIPTGTKGSI